ncbi:MAG: hypothetical protein RDV48_08620 [Candidatus Eremiobacteraeota bacterium]|nr:hypothetical protein [Candidatus Eremiobacteraeota bacterium]
MENKKDLEKRDCKPNNYNYISSSLRFNKAFTGKEEILLGIEQLLLKSLLSPPPNEQPESIKFVRVFEGKRRLVLTYWCSELRRHRALASQLLHACRVRFN